MPGFRLPFWPIIEVRHSLVEAESTLSAEDEALLGLSEEACSCANRGELEKAGEAVRLMLSRRPGDFSTRYVCASFAEYRGETSEAMEHLAICLALRPGFYPTHMRLARLLVRQGAHDSARAVLEAGWKIAERRHPRKDREEACRRWFAVLDRTEEGA